LIYLKRMADSAQVGLTRNNSLSGWFTGAAAAIAGSTMSQRWVNLPSIAVAILTSPNTLCHLPKARLVVTMMEALVELP